MTGIEATTALSENQCRLCGGRLARKFSRTVLSRYEVGYFECADCEALQTEPPYWLAEAYSGNNLAVADTGAVLRNLESQAIVYVIARVVHIPANAAILDFGGGNGLLCRLLRDLGFDARFLEPNATNDFAQGFQVEGMDQRYDMICSFEVFEHMSSPREAFAELLGAKPEVCIVGTATYRGQGDDWWYLGPESGQHVFFYSEQAMQYAASTHFYSYAGFGATHIFTKRPLSRVQSAILRRFLRPSGLRLLRMWVAHKLSYEWATKDAKHLLM